MACQQLAPTPGRDSSGTHEAKVTTQPLSQVHHEGEELDLFPIINYS
jgi:hypothetical protein